jgi:hypothetical protein
VETRPNGLHKEDLLLLGNCNELVQLSEVKGERLLAEDMLASKEGSLGVGMVEGVRCANVDGVDILVSVSIALSGRAR